MTWESMIADLSRDAHVGLAQPPERIPGQSKGGDPMSKAQLRYVVLAVFVLVVITGGTALAVAPGSPFRLGVLNAVQKVTRLTGSVASAMLRITNNGTGPAIELKVQPGAPPLSVNSETKVEHLNADSVDGLDASAFLRSDGKAADSSRLDGLNSNAFMGATVTKRESAISIGTALGDGTRYIDQSCNAGEVLLSGGPANISDGTVLLESFPAPGGTNTWRARIHNDGSDDAFSVVILCASR